VAGEASFGEDGPDLPFEELDPFAIGSGRVLRGAQGGPGAAEDLQQQGRPGRASQETREAWQRGSFLQGE
jgi:hypothetical protein